ncbi:MAG: aminoacetone oxidase family FAD-binding enzyme [Eggerthellaceae bacterium]|nr:aminoacetone oxidase family FAD-binding enzyme [Eggerthellaceae bacterium]
MGVAPLFYNQPMFDMVIIGAGASGLACAVCALEAANANATQGERALKVCILEAADKIGRPILRSGNGRCNFSNANVTPEAYNNGPAVSATLRALADAAPAHGISPSTPNVVTGFLQRLGLVWRQESEGRLYPLTNKASTVLDVLRSPLLRFGAEIRTGAVVEKVVPPNAPGSHFTIHLQGGELVRARKAVIASGGRAGALGLDGLIPYAAPTPVLGPLATEGKQTKPLDNIRARCTVSLLRDGSLIAQEQGEVMFRKYGVSGIAIFNLSRASRAGDILQIDFAPGMFANGAMEERRQTLAAVLAKAPSHYELLQGIVLPLVADQLLKSARLEGAHEATDASAKAIQEQLHSFQLTVKGIGDADLCQVMRGGFAPEAVDPATLEAKEVPGLYILGEALDIDGACGGFNLHWAFACGMLAGWHMGVR